MQKFFNPRLREGGDFFFHKLSFNSTYVFNPRLREGGDHHRNWSIGYHNIFNPRLREGGDMLHPITLNALL